MIDTHCHLTIEPLASEVESVLDRAAVAGVDRVICVGTSPADSQRAAALARRDARVYASVGVHPHEAGRFNERSEVVGLLQDLVAGGTGAGSRVVALGEMGLDYHYPDPPVKQQRRLLAWQLQLAADIAADTTDDRDTGDTAGASGGGGDFRGGMPIIIHNRKATGDLLAVIRDSGLAGDRFVFHCFTGDRAELEAILETGAMVSLTGIVTFKNASELAEAAAHIPLDRLMVETDSPYLTPEPYRRVRPNEPCYVPWVARFLAQQRGMTFESFVRVVDRNAERFFGLPAGG